MPRQKRRLTTGCVPVRGGDWRSSRCRYCRDLSDPRLIRAAQTNIIHNGRHSWENALEGHARYVDSPGDVARSLGVAIIRYHGVSRPSQVWVFLLYYADRLHASRVGSRSCLLENRGQSPWFCVGFIRYVATVAYVVTVVHSHTPS